MKIRKTSLVLTAAFTGLLGGTMARLERCSVIRQLQPDSVLARRSAFDHFQCRQEGQACLQRQEFLQGQGRLQDRRQRLQRQELLQRQGRLRDRRLHEASK